MTVIYKKELKSYFHSMDGYAFVSFLMLFTGIYYTAYNLALGYPYFSIALSSAMFIFLFVVPVLTMKSFAKEQRYESEEQLLRSRVSAGQIVMGKYLAMITVFGVPIIISCVYPILIKLQGMAYLKVDYTAIFLFFLVGCVYIAIGMFLASLTDSSMIAMVTTFTVLLVLSFWGELLDILSKNMVGGLLYDFLARLNFATLLDDLMQSSLLHMGDVLFCISLLFLFVFLTIFIVQEKCHRKVLWSVIVIVGVMIVNLVATKLPERWKLIDLSPERYLKITDTSITFLKDLDKEVEIHVFAKQDSVDERISVFLDRYAALSKKLSVEWADPLSRPTELTKYNASSDTILVLCEETGKRVEFSIDEFFLYEYNEEAYSNGSYSHTENFDGEGLLTNAVNDVTSKLEEVNDISIPVKTSEFGLNETKSTGASTLIVVFGVPAVILLIGFSIWRRDGRQSKEET